MIQAGSAEGVLRSRFAKAKLAADVPQSYVTRRKDLETMLAIMRTWEWGSTETFGGRSPKHLAVLLGLVLIATAVVAIGRRIPQVHRRAVERVAGILLLGIWLAGAMWDFANPRATLATSLPLHWCDVTGILAGLAFFLPGVRPLRAMLHFWALCICSIAFLQPAIKFGPAYPDFWLYFGTHTAIVTAAVYDRCVRGFVPTMRDCFTAAGLAVAWSLMLVPINLALDENYGYVGRTTRAARTAVLALGPWPWRVVVLWVIATALMLSLWAVQRAAEWMVAKRRPARAGSSETHMITRRIRPLSEGDLAQAA